MVSPLLYFSNSSSFIFFLFGCIDHTRKMSTQQTSANEAVHPLRSVAKDQCSKSWGLINRIISHILLYKQWCMQPGQAVIRILLWPSTPFFTRIMSIILNCWQWLRYFWNICKQRDDDKIGENSLHIYNIYTPTSVMIYSNSVAYWSIYIFTRAYRSYFQQ